MRLGTQAVLSKIGNIRFQSFYSDFSRNICGDKDGKKMSRLNTSTTQASGKAMLFLFADITFSQAVTVKTLACCMGNKFPPAANAESSQSAGDTPRDIPFHHHLSGLRYCN